MSEPIDPTQFIITRKRKKYKFAVFANSPLCFEADEWRQQAFAPTVLELGAGTALFSVGMAEAFPNEHIAACDVKADRLITGARQAEASQLTNIRFIRTHGQQLEGLFAPHSLSAIWLTFPDPFPKKRAAKHRLTHGRYLKLYEKLLAPSGALYFKTDNHPLFDWSLEELVTNDWSLDQLSYDLHASNLPEHYKIKTSYETRFLAEGLSTHFVRARIGQSW